MRFGGNIANEACDEVVECDDPVGSGESGTVMGVGRVCRFNSGGVVCCAGTADLESGRSLVGVMGGSCSVDLNRWEPAYSGFQLARFADEVDVDASAIFELPLWSLPDAPSAASSALALSSHFPLTVSMLLPTRWVGVHLRVA